PGIHYPTKKLELHLIQLKILTLLQSARRSEVIGISWVDKSLVQITRIGIDADVQIAIRRVSHFVSKIWSIRTPELWAGVLAFLNRHIFLRRGTFVGNYLLCNCRR